MDNQTAMKKINIMWEMRWDWR